MNQIDPIVYFNQLLTKIVLKIDNKNAATVFYAKHFNSMNPSIRSYLNYLEESFGIGTNEVDLINGALKTNEIKEINPILLQELTKQANSNFKEQIIGKINEFEEEQQKCFEIICKEEIMNKRVIEQQKRINNIQQALLIMKKEVVRTQMKIKYLPLDCSQTPPLQISNETQQSNEETNGAQQSNCVFVFQTVASEENEGRIGQLKNSLEPLEVHDFWEGYGLGLIPKTVLMIIEGAVETMGQDIQLIRSLYDSSKIYLVYLYKKNKINHIQEKTNIAMEFDVQKKKGLFLEDQNFRRIINYCFN